MFKSKTTKYISEIDRFLQIFDETHPPSLSQLAEIKKYKEIEDRRNQPKESKQEKI